MKTTLFYRCSLTTFLPHTSVIRFAFRRLSPPTRPPLPSFSRGSSLGYSSRFHSDCCKSASHHESTAKNARNDSGLTPSDATRMLHHEEDHRAQHPAASRVRKDGCRRQDGEDTTTTRTHPSSPAAHVGSTEDLVLFSATTTEVEDVKWSGEDGEMKSACSSSSSPLPSTTPVPATTTSTRSASPSFSPAGYVRHHTRLLCSIIAAPNERRHRKRRRITGILRKLELDAPSWLLPSLTVENTHTKPSSFHGSEVLPPELMVSFLSAIASAKFLFRGVSSTASDAGPGTPAVNPYEVSDSFQDFVALCVGVGARDDRFSSSSSSPSPALYARWLSLLSAAVLLEASGTQLEALCQKLAAPESLSHATPAMLSTALHWISLAVKRCEMVPPVLLPLFARVMEVPRWERPEVLSILSSLVRLRSTYDMEVAHRVSRLGMSHVPQYTTKEVVFGLTSMAYVSHIHEGYGRAVLQRCLEVLPEVPAKEMGDIAKFVALLNTNTRRHHTMALACGPSIRRVVYAIADRSQELLGTFSFREAKYVLRCLKQHDVKHALVFASLVPVAMTSE